VITGHSAQQIPKFTSKVITHKSTFLDIHNYCAKREEKKRKEKMERSYQVRYCVHLSYDLLRMVLGEVEGASATPSKLKIQT